jgi:hypothetical protein
MAKRPNRYLEARMYMAGGSVGLLLILWSVFAIKDRSFLSQNASATDGQVEAAATAVPAATAAPASSSSSSRSSSTTARATTVPTATPQPQTRSKAS